MWSADRILASLDARCAAFTFPMLDNGYVYPAATRLALHRSDDEWAMTIEVFGFAPRAGLPDVHVYVFGSHLPEDATPHPGAGLTFRPIAEGSWQDDETAELVAEDATQVELRGVAVAIPPREVFAAHGIELVEAPRIHTFELCRVLAATHRDAVLASGDERRGAVQPGLRELLLLDEWNHPDVVDASERPSGSECFQQLARVLAAGDVRGYRPRRPPNTHWSNWPDGGSL